MEIITVIQHHMNEKLPAHTTRLARGEMGEEEMVGYLGGIEPESGFTIRFQRVELYSDFGDTSMTYTFKFSDGGWILI